MSAFATAGRTLLDVFTLGPTFPLHHVSRLLGRRHHHTTLRNVGRITIRPRMSDAETFVDIFRRGAYDISWLKQYDGILAAYHAILERGASPIIIDAGANVGAASIWFDKTFPKCRIYAVEPDAGNAAILRLNVGGRPNIEVIEAAIGSRTGHVSLKNPSDQAWAIQVERDGAGAIAATTVPEILANNDAADLFLVKIDIEGFEADLFEDNIAWLDQVRVVIIEPHDWMLPGAGTSRNFQRAMLERDFEMVISGENLAYIRL